MENQDNIFENEELANTVVTGGVEYVAFKNLGVADVKLTHIAYLGEHKYTGPDAPPNGKPNPKIGLVLTSNIPQIIIDKGVKSKSDDSTYQWTWETTYSTSPKSKLYQNFLSNAGIKSNEAITIKDFKERFLGVDFTISTKHVETSKGSKLSKIQNIILEDVEPVELDPEKVKFPQWLLKEEYLKAPHSQSVCYLDPSKSVKLEDLKKVDEEQADRPDSQESDSLT